MSSNVLSRVVAIHELRAEINRLAHQQGESLKKAAFLGMTPDEAEGYTHRRMTIMKLVQQLSTLNESQ